MRPGRPNNGAWRSCFRRAGVCAAGEAESQDNCLAGASPLFARESAPSLAIIPRGFCIFGETFDAEAADRAGDAGLGTVRADGFCDSHTSPPNTQAERQVTDEVGRHMT